jgi:hypothetical protein
MNAKCHAHDRLYFAVVSLNGAVDFGSQEEIRAAAVELKAAQKESQEVLYPAESGTNQKEK